MSDTNKFFLWLLGACTVASVVLFLLVKLPLLAAISTYIGLVLTACILELDDTNTYDESLDTSR